MVENSVEGHNSELPMEPSADLLQHEDADSERADVQRQMLKRFEALSQNFRCEMQELFGQENEAAKDVGRLEQELLDLQHELHAERASAAATACSVWRYMETWQACHMAGVFGREDATSEDGRTCPEFCQPGETMSVSDLQRIVEAVLKVRAADAEPLLIQAQRQSASLQDQLEAGQIEISRLRTELAEAQKLKSEEERQLIEFKLLRSKENELHSSKMEVQHLQAELDELRTGFRQLEARSVQHQSTIKEKSEKIIGLVKQLDHEVEQVRLLSDENNTLRLELGRDTEYFKVATACTDPLSYRSAAGALAEDLQNEEHQFREDLRSLAAKFAGPGPGDQYNRWCELQVSRVTELHCSFLHRLQDLQKDFPADVKVEFTTPTEEAQKGWMQQEAAMAQAGVEFQEAEQEHSRRWEEHRLKLTFERDSKVKQLLDQAERSQSKAEKQLLMQQAKLYGQRIDAQMDRAWEEQRQEREVRWSQHQQQKQELRQKIKEESLAMAQRAEDQASASSRFAEAASKKLAAVEDAWLRNAERAASVAASTFKSRDLESCLHALQTSMGAAADSVGCAGCVSSSASKLPARGSQHLGVGLVIDQVESILTSRMEMRTKLRADLEDQSRQQLRNCVEKFVQREGADGEDLPESRQAASITGLLRVRQHRHVSDVLRRQFQDYLLVLRLCSLGAQWLSPSDATSAEDLPPLPPQLAPQTEGSCSQGARKTEEAEVDDAAFEGNFLYRTLCQKLLERALKLLSESQRDELLALKRAYAAEQRLVLQHLCQLETDFVDKAVQQDLLEYEVQLAARLLADSERHFSEERQRTASRVSTDVAAQLEQYKREVAQEDQAIVRDRHKWLMSRIVFLQANGTVNPNDRALLARLRAELHACDAKIDEFSALEAEAHSMTPEREVEASCLVSGPRRRSSGELASAEVPGRAALLGPEELPRQPLGGRPNRLTMPFGLRRESPDFGVKAPALPMDWAFSPPPLHGNLGTRLKTDFLAPKSAYGLPDATMPQAVEMPAGSPPRPPIKTSPSTRTRTSRLPPVPLTAR